MAVTPVVESPPGKNSRLHCSRVNWRWDMKGFRAEGASYASKQLDLARAANARVSGVSSYKRAPVSVCLQERSPLC